MAPSGKELSETLREAYDLEPNELGRATGKAAAEAGKVVGTAVVATTLAATLSEQPNADLISLPEPTPIVQEYWTEEEATPVEEAVPDEATPSLLARIFKLLKYLLVALALVVGILAGALKGCASLVSPVAPSDEERQEQTQGHATSETDERGVAYEVGA